MKNRVELSKVVPCAPLQTANTGVMNHIPRLDPGMRVKKYVTEDVEAMITSVKALDWLVHSPLPTMDRKELMIGEMIRLANHNVASYFRKLMATSMIIASSVCTQISPSLRRMAVTSSAVVSAVGAPKAAFASVFKNYKQLAPVEKLGTTPLFYVCNSGGNPYLQEDLQTGKSDQRIIVYFMSSEDASEYLNEMVQGSPQNVNEFRVMATSMEKVVQRIQYKKQSRKLGRFPMSTVYRIQPSSRQCSNADKVLTTAAASSSAATAATATSNPVVTIPMFHVKGMVIKRAGGELVSPYYFTLEDLKEDWAKLQSKRTDKLPVNPKVEVVDFTDVMSLSQGIHTASVPGAGSSRQLEMGSVQGKGKTVKQVSPEAAEARAKAMKVASNPGIVPPRREIDMLRRYYRNEAGIKNEYQQTRIIGLT